MMVDKVVDNNESKALSKVKMHGEFKYVTLRGCNWSEHTDSAVEMQSRAILHGAKSGHRSKNNKL